MVAANRTCNSQGSKYLFLFVDAVSSKCSTKFLYLLFCKQIFNSYLILPQLKERCVTTLGYFLVGEPSFPHVEAVLKALFVLKEEKQIDLQFTVGEALACVSAGPLCSLARDPWQVGGASDQRGEVDNAVMERMLTVVIGDYCTSTAPLVRQVWWRTCYS